jgi:hypothetical protein
MTTKPLSYDDIERATVPTPDLAWRPSRAQEEAAMAGFRASTPEEDVLHGRVMAALAGFALAGRDLSNLSIEVDGAEVTLRGYAPDIHTIDTIESRVRDVAGVAAVHNELVVRAA